MVIRYILAKVTMRKMIKMGYDLEPTAGAASRTRNACSHCGSGCAKASSLIMNLPKFSDQGLWGNNYTRNQTLTCRAALRDGATSQSINIVHPRHTEFLCMYSFPGLDYSLALVHSSKPSQGKRHTQLTMALPHLCIPESF
jgi:hypothetical protein